MQQFHVTMRDPHTGDNRIVTVQARSSFEARHLAETANPFLGFVHAQQVQR